MIFDRSEWCEEAAEKLLPLVSEAIRPEFPNRVKAGVYVLWRVHDDDFQSWLVTSIDSLGGGKTQLNLECIEGEKAREIVKELIERVRPLGVTQIRFESMHPEKIVQRFIRPLGFEREATVFRLDL